MFKGSVASDDMQEVVQALKSAAEPTRLRLLFLLSQAEYTVTELCAVLAQRQPRISRHLRLLTEAGFLDRFREQQCVYYRAPVSGLHRQWLRQLLSMLDPERMPHIVFLTAHDEYALQAFEENAFDYLLKPVDPARLEKTLHRLRRDRSPQNMTVLQDANHLKQIPCSGLNRVYLMKFDEIEYVSSKQSGVYVVGANGQERFTELTLRTLEEKTPLIRCHRQYLINPDRIKEIQFTDNGLAEITTTAGLSVPVSRRFLSPLKDRLGMR